MTLVFLMVEPKIIELKVNGKYLTLVGSNHGKFSFSKCGESDFLKRKYFYEGLIDESDIVVLEQPVGGEFYEDISFFAKLGLIAYDSNKEIYIIDPNNVRANNLQKFLCENFEKDGKLPLEIHEGFTGKVSYERYKKDHPFEGYIDYLNNIGEFYFKIAHGINDWRNVVIAKGLAEKISKLDAENIVAIHGAQHTRPIAFYINNPELRQQKFEGYKHFNEVGRQGIKKFTPVFDINNMDKCIWKRELILPDAHTIIVKRI